MPLRVFIAAPNNPSGYSIEKFSNSNCAGTPTSLYSYPLVTCSAIYVSTDLFYGFPTGYNDYVTTTVQCSSGPTAPPTQAPSGPSFTPTAAPSKPTFKPSSKPTLVPTPLTQTTAYISQYLYNTSSCSGAAYSITSYSLGICFPYESFYAVYSKGTPSPAGTITLVLTTYSDSQCTSSVASSSSNILATTCSSGSNYTYSVTAPDVPESVAKRLDSMKELIFLAFQ